jgi:ACT domain-containing protein
VSLYILVPFIIRFITVITLYNMTKRKAGRPKTITKLVENSLVLAFSNGYNTQEACRHAGIHRATFYRHLETHPDFAERVEAAKETLVNLARKRVVDAIAKGHIPTSRWYLAHKDPEFSTSYQAFMSATHIQEYARRAAIIARLEHQVRVLSDKLEAKST